MADLRDRVALVIGGAAGMGLASARALAGRGAHVIIADRDGEAAARGAGDIREDGGSASGRAVDGASLPELRDLFDAVALEHGRMHILFNNVGTRCAAGFDVNEAEFDQAFDVNLKSHFFATNYAVPLMRPCAPHASIIYMSSAGGLRTGSRAAPLYSMSKAGVVMLARVAARDLGPAGIRVNALCPGHIETAFPRLWSGLSDADYQARIERSSQNIPLRRIGQPEDVAGVVAFLASDESMYVTGLAIPIDGGQSA